MINEFKDLNSFKDEMKGWLKEENKCGFPFRRVEHKDDFIYSPEMRYVNPEIDMIVQEVRKDLLNRSEVGIKKYGVTLDRKDLGLKEWLEHAYCECLDQALYLKRAIKEL